MRNKLATAITILLTATFFSCTPYGDKVTINDHLEVFVTKEATEAEGKKLGEYFATLDSSKENQKSIQLSKEADVYTVKLVIPDEHVNNPELETSFQAIQYLIKTNVFPGKKVNLILADEKFKNKKAVQELADTRMFEEESEVETPVDSTVQGQ